MQSVSYNDMTALHKAKLMRKESAHCAGGENGFLKRPGMVDEFDQQVSTSMDGKPICLHPDCPKTYSIISIRATN